MIWDFKPYPNMKHSGAPWLGEVPDHWEIKRLGQMGRFLKGCGGNKDDEEASGVPCIRYGDLYTTHTYFVVKSRSFVSTSIAQSYTPIRFGDVLFAASGETIEEIGKSAVNLIQSEACCSGDTIVFRSALALESRFMGYATDCRAAVAQKASMGRGITIKHIYGDQLKYLTLALPPLPEQRAIARFLDHADQRIRRYIRARQKLIKLLDEQKQAIIEGAITRGLDPDVRLKPSGVNWLGEVPHHWVVASLRFHYHQCLGKMVDAKRVSGTRLLPYLRNLDVRWDRINTANLPQIDVAPEQLERYTLRVGDLLVCEGRHLGRAAFWRGELPICAFQKALHRLRPRKRTRDAPRYLFYCLYVVHFKDAFGASSDDNSIPHLTGEMLRAHKFPFPPLEEQESIAAHLDDRIATLDRARAVIESEISRVREYRSRLIADIVTGKVDVRETAARLPDVSAEPERPEEDVASREVEMERDEGLEYQIAEVDQ